MTFGDAFFGLSWLDAIIRVLIIVTAMTVVVVYLTWGERKVIARFQMRLGPMRTGADRPHAGRRGCAQAALEGGHPPA